MREKQLALVITFHSTTEAMAMERFCTENALPGRLIPVPGMITSGCGLAWKAQPDQRQELLAGMQEAGLQHEQEYIVLI